MTNRSGSAFSRRTFIRGAAFTVPVVGAAVLAPTALAAPQECGDPSGKVGN
ncbi:hypothetical protein [Mycolicibacterium peregrinum]